MTVMTQMTQNSLPFLLGCGYERATVRNILDFPNQFNPPAQIITLERNYRSTQPIPAAANGVIGLAQERFTKNLWTNRTAADRPQLVSVRDEAAQADYIVASYELYNI